MAKKRTVIGHLDRGGDKPVPAGDVGPAASALTTIDPAASLLSVLLESSIDGIAVFDAVHGEDGTIVDFEFVTVSSSAERIVHRSAIELVGTKLSRFLPQIPPDRLDRYADVVATATPWTTRVQWDDSEGRWFDITAAPFAAHSLVLIFRDVTDRLSIDELMEEYRRRQRVLERQALQDPLTGVANRLLIETRLEHALSRLDRTAASLAVLFIDLDGFKSINDSHGHGAGDAVLIEVATRLRSASRSYDTIGRLGGDEFVVVCEDLDDTWAIDRIAHRLLSVCRAPIMIGEHKLVVTASVGVAIADSSATDPLSLLHDADTAMYRAKSEGGGRVEYANGAVHERTLIRHDVEIGLHQAIAGNALHIDFDDVRAADGGEVARRVRVGWLHPEHGLVGTATLADAAGAVGLVATLTDWVVDRALDRLAGWLATPSDPARFVLVDIDHRALCDTGFVDRLVDHLARHRCDPSSLCIALDGGHLTAHLEQVRPVLDQLAGLGVRIARDGVGAAGSSLTYLRGLPIDMVILDDALTDELGSSNELLKLVLDVAKGGQRVVIAPASATPGHREFLFGLGVDLLYDIPAD